MPALPAHCLVVAHANRGRAALPSTAGGRPKRSHACALGLAWPLIIRANSDSDTRYVFSAPEAMASKMAISSGDRGGECEGSSSATLTAARREVRPAQAPPRAGPAPRRPRPARRRRADPGARDPRRYPQVPRRCPLPQRSGAPSCLYRAASGVQPGEGHKSIWVWVREAMHIVASDAQRRPRERHCG